MGNTEGTPNGTEQPLAEKVNEALKTHVVDGKLKLPDDFDPALRIAVMAEKKARDTQSAFTKSRQELARLKAEKEELEKLAAQSTSTLSKEQIEELDSLKFEDPDAWFELKRKYETEAQQLAQNKIKEVTSAAAEKAVQELTLIERKEALNNFTAETGIVLTDDVMMNDIPPRLQQQMGSLPFEEYLQKVADYLGKGKVVKDTDKGLEQTNINKISGAEVPSDSWTPQLGDGIL